MPTSGKDMVKELRKGGWVIARVEGSHHIMKKDGVPPIAVPVHGNKALGAGLEAQIRKTAGLPKK